MIAVIDYGVGNLFSLCASLKHLNAEYVVTNDKEVIKNADKIILPGVGAFGDAKDKLEKTGLIPLIKEKVESGITATFNKQKYGNHNIEEMLSSQLKYDND